jgi:hypothetical protein
MNFFSLIFGSWSEVVIVPEVTAKRRLARKFEVG